MRASLVVRAIFRSIIKYVHVWSSLSSTAARGIFLHSRAAKAAKTHVSKGKGGETPFTKPEMIKISGLRPFPVTKGLPLAQFLLLVSTLKSKTIEWVLVYYSTGSRISPATGEQRGRVRPCRGGYQATASISEVSGQPNSMA